MIPILIRLIAHHYFDSQRNQYLSVKYILSYLNPVFNLHPAIAKEVPAASP